jgi:hypothetical protein
MNKSQIDIRDCYAQRMTLPDILEYQKKFNPVPLCFSGDYPMYAVYNCDGVRIGVCSEEYKGGVQ